MLVAAGDFSLTHSLSEDMYLCPSVTVFLSIHHRSDEDATN